MKSDLNPPVKTTCPYCGVGCGVEVSKGAENTISVNGDPDHPANFGRLCSKGAALAETISLDGRLLYPEIGDKRVTWDHAVEKVAKTFSETIRQHGPDSVAFYVSGQILTEDYYVANKLMKGFMGSANIDTNSRLCMASSVAGHRKAFGTDTVPGTYEDLELADLIVLVGSNLAWCHPVLYQRIEAAKLARPEMKVVLVDPRRTMTANLADYHLAIAADGDTALFTGLLCHLADQGKLDETYVKNHTNGFREALAAARSHQQETDELTGLSRHELEQFYALFANTEKVVTVYSQGVNQSVGGTDKVNSILNCHLATGRIGKPGCGPFSVTGQPNAMGGREVGGLANMLACHMDLENEGHRQIVGEFWQVSDVPSKPGLKAIDMFRGVEDGRIKAIWIMSTNPVDSLPEADRVAAALEACPFVVVSDILEDTDTMRYADVKLPAAAWGEKEGTVTNSERRISRQRAFLKSPGEAKPDWWHLVEVARKMGFAAAFDFASPAEIFDEYARLSATHNQGMRDFDIGQLVDLSREEYENLAPVQWPVALGQKNKSRFFSEGDFYTPDKKARFVSVQPMANVSNKTSKAFVLNTGRVRDHWHTMTRTARSPRLSSHLGEPFCEIHPQDAVRLGVAPASLVRIENGLGHVLVRALITDRVQPGTIFVPIHWTDVFASNARIDKLVPAVVDPFSGQPASKKVRVGVAPERVGAFAFMVSRQKPDLRATHATYWALAECIGGWRAELAFASRRDALFFGEAFAKNTVGDQAIDYNAPGCEKHRLAVFDGNRLSMSYYMSPAPVMLSREWMVEQLQVTFENAAQKGRVLAGRADAAMPDKGPIVCSCMNVGMNEIVAAIHDGRITSQEIGDITKAGTNCGSCRAEIDGMINGYIHQTKIAAE